MKARVELTNPFSKTKYFKYTKKRIVKWIWCDRDSLILSNSPSCESDSKLKELEKAIHAFPQNDLFNLGISAD